MEHPNQEERNKKRKSSEIENVDPKFFVYTNETKKDDVPKKTLTHLRVDSSVRKIPEGTFLGCDSLQHVQLPETLFIIDEFAFANCSKLKCVQFVSDASLAISSFTPNPEDGLLVFPEWAELQIKDFAFKKCSVLRKVVVSSIKTKLIDGVFRSCHGLLSAELPEGIQVIEPWLFSDCKSLTTVKIPSSVIEIGESAFWGCQSLASFELPGGLVKIGETSFRECNSIETLHIPSTLSSIGWSAFENCSGLKHITLPPALERIEDFTFHRCHRLEYIEIPSAVSFIGMRAFGFCHCLSHVRIPPRVENSDSNAFEGCISLITIELPEGILFNIELEGCASLVNLGPVNQSKFYLEEFFQDSRLGSVAYEDRNHVRKLKHRFDNSPLNKICYYQSYHSSEDTMVQLRCLMEDDPLGATNQTDEFGMTPLHVLSLSQTPNLDMLVEVMKQGHLDHIVLGKDSFGRTPIDYLCLNRMPNCINVIRTVFQTRYDYLLGLERSGIPDAMWQAVDEALAVDWSSRRKEVYRVYVELANYERKEIFSLMELRLWKIKIDQLGSKKQQIVDRESCRISSGASVVISHVLPFLGKLDVEDYVVSAS
eukprot:scaffold167_cov110-Cylindrotheca_fusiformis.AAC.26